MRSEKSKSAFDESWNTCPNRGYAKKILICIAVTCVSCSPNSSKDREVDGKLGAVTISKPERNLVSVPPRVSEREPILVTGEEILKFPSGPCFNLGLLRELGPKTINVNRSDAERKVNLSTVSPLKFVDQIPKGVESLGVKSPVYLLRFDTRLSKLDFVPPEENLEELYLYGADRFLADLRPTSGELPEDFRFYTPRTAIDVGQWREYVARGDVYELEQSKNRDGGIKFYAFSPGGKYDLNRVVKYYGYDFEKVRSVEILPSDYVPEPFTLVGISRVPFQKTDYSARALQYLFDGQLHSEFAITRDYLLNSDEIFETFNRILSAAIVKCDDGALEQ